MNPIQLQLASDKFWAMQPGAFSAFSGMLEEKAASFFDSTEKKTSYAIENQVAIIPIEGPVLRQQFLGYGAGLMEIGAALEDALRNPQVKAILFSVCSPGGQARGVKELADAISAASAVKPCAAFVDGLCASAAYWIASATGQIYAGPSSEVGSIGVILRHIDFSESNKSCGLNFTYITAGSYKAVGNPDSPLSETDFSVLQARVNEIYEMFCNDVAKNMKLDPDKRDDWADGRDFLAGEAKKLGLVTEMVSSRDEAIKNLVKEFHMEKSEFAQKYPDLLASIEADAKKSALVELDAKVKQASESAVSSTLELMEIACGKEAADKVRALCATGLTPAQLAAASKALAPEAAANSGRQAQILNAIKQASPAPLGPDAAPADECAAFISRVGKM